VDSFTLRKIEFDPVRRILGGFAATSLGKALATRINPSRNPRIVKLWLDQTSQMVAAIRGVGLPPFGGVSDVTESLGKAVPGGDCSADDFAAIAACLEGAANVKAYVDALDEGLTHLHEMSQHIGDFGGEVRAIRSVVESDGTIRDDASERLAGIRRETTATAQHIHDVIYGYLRQPEVARLLQNPTVALHGDRYVLPVKADNRGRLPGVVHRESNTGATVFVEPNASVELNNRLADLRQDERDEIRRLLNMLALRVQARAAQIGSTLRTLAQVDLISAKAQYAYQFDMLAPEVTERGPLQLHQARHPLLVDQYRRATQRSGEHSEAHAQEPHPVVPIDVRLGSDFDLLVITGSNTGGKTVALKTVALLAVMAQSGLHIPAGAGSTLPVFRDVFIDVGDEQSLQQSLSTFGAHVKRVKYILRRAGKDSLVLLDELGAGTDPDEGGAIGQAILDELLRVGCVGMVTTHLSILKAYAFTHDRVDNASVDFDTKTLSPTYHLRIGTPGESHAITVARRLGLPRRITGDARKHLDGQGKQFRKAIRATGQARQVAEEARQEAHAAQIEARTQQEVYESKLADLHSLQQEFETWLASLPDWQAGDEIFVPSVNKTGRLVRMELHSQNALVDVGNMQIEVPLKELMPDLGQPAVRKEIAALRQQILDQASATEAARAEAERMRDQYRESLRQQEMRGRQFDQWLGAIARLKPGDEVPIARKPGKAKVVSVDMPGLRVTVVPIGGEARPAPRKANTAYRDVTRLGLVPDATREEKANEEIVIPLQDVFPQTGPFAPRPPRPSRAQGAPARGQQGRARPAAVANGEEGRQAGEQKAPEPDRPMQHRDERSKAAVRSKEALLNAKPGSKVFVVPFKKRATLIRVNAEKGLALVQSGIFELELPITDLEPVSEE
jgi:DNA mismatch repair protein MutS2